MGIIGGALKIATWPIRKPVEWVMKGTVNAASHLDVAGTIKNRISSITGGIRRAAKAVIGTVRNKWNGYEYVPEGGPVKNVGIVGIVKHIYHSVKDALISEKHGLLRLDQYGPNPFEIARRVAFNAYNIVGKTVLNAGATISPEIATKVDQIAQSAIDVLAGGVIGSPFAEQEAGHGNGHGGGEAHGAHAPAAAHAAPAAHAPAAHAPAAAHAAPAHAH